jgi:hypothetical protein
MLRLQPDLVDTEDRGDKRAVLSRRERLSQVLV